MVYIDAQNVYRTARETFAGSAPVRPVGQVDPMRAAGLICTRGPAGVVRELAEVRIYTGRPDSTRERRTYAAHMRQCAAWERAGAIVLPRPLRYPTQWPSVPAEEKGIDVQLAVDFVADAVDGRYDVGIIFSTDSDLRPALDFVAERFSGIRRAESAAWRAPGSNRAIKAERRRTWCHYLDNADYLQVHDPRDYNIP